MTKKLQKTAKNWLTLKTCALLFKSFKQGLEFGEPIPVFDSRYPGKLEGILDSVRQTYDGNYLNATVADASAAYFNQLIRGHPFENGNKRMAVLFSHFFLLRNGVDFTLGNRQMYRFALIIAKAGESGIKADETKRWCKQIIIRFTEEKK